MMISDETIKEMRELREWNEQRNRQESVNRATIKRMRTLFTREEITKWAVIDAMIYTVSNYTEPSADPNAVRRGLLPQEDVNNDEK